MNAPSPEHIAAIHEQLVDWLRRTHPHEHPLTIIVALTYEIGRLVRVAELPRAERAHMLEQVFETMRAHVVDGPPN
jgi:hypothetical protein